MIFQRLIKHFEIKVVVNYLITSVILHWLKNFSVIVEKLLFLYFFFLYFPLSFFFSFFSFFVTNSQLCLMLAFFIARWLACCYVASDSSGFSL